MRRYIHKSLAALLCVCLLTTPVSAIAEPASSPSGPSAGPAVPFAGEEASTTVSVLVVGLSILGKTDDIAASLADIRADMGKPVDQQTYVLKVVVSGANPDVCSYSWTRGVLGVDGSVAPDQAFADDRPQHLLSDDVAAGLLETGRTYRYTVEVADPASGSSASASMDVTLSDEYLDRTLASAAGVTVQGALHRSLADADLAATPLDERSAAYAFLLEAAAGMRVEGAWHVGLPTAPDGTPAYRGDLGVSFPVDLPDGAEVTVLRLGASGAVEQIAAQVVGGRALGKTGALGAFALAVPAQGTCSVTAEAGAGGSVSPAAPVEFAPGAKPVYALLPHEGYVLDRVEVDGAAVQAAGNAYVFPPLEGDHVLRAFFAPAVVDEGRQHTVTAQVQGEGGLVALGGAQPSASQSMPAAHGTAVRVLLVPAEGYAVDEVLVRKGNVPAERAVVFGDELLLPAVLDDTEVTVTFRSGSPLPVVTRTVTAEVVDGRGTVSPAQADVPHGGTATVSLAAEDGHRLNAVMLDGDDVTGQVRGGKLTLQNVVADHRVEVAFEPVPRDPAAPDCVTVEARAGAGGAVSPAGGVLVPRGSAQTFSFFPEQGKQVSALSIDGREFAFNGSSYTLFDIQADTELSVAFSDAGSVPRPQPGAYTVTAQAAAHGTVSPSGEVRVIEGGSVLFALLPDEGYEVDEVLVDGAVVQSGGFSFRLADVAKDARVEVTFKERKHLLPDDTLVSVEVAVEVTSDSGEGGTVSPSGSLRLVAGSSQTFYAYPEPGFGLDAVLVNGQPVPAHAVVAPTLRSLSAVLPQSAYCFTVDNLAEDAQVSVRFKRLADGEPAPSPVPVHEVSASAEGSGMISPAGAVRVPSGGGASFTVRADTGWHLAALTVDGQDATGRLSGGVLALENVRADTQVRAVFAADAEEPGPAAPFTVRATSSAGGRVSPSGDVPVRAGGCQTFAFFPEEGYVLDKVEAGGRTVTPVDGTYTMYDVAADTTLHATFRLRASGDPDPVLPDTFPVTATASEGGSVTPSGRLDVVRGQEVLFALESDEGYKLSRVTLDDADVTSQVQNMTFMLANVEAAHGLHAEFAPVEEPDPPVTLHTIAATVDGGHGRVSPSNAVEVAHGASQTFYFYPDEGYAVGAVTVDGARLAWSRASYAFLDVRGDHTLAVSFKAAPTPAPTPDDPSGTGEGGSSGTGSGAASPWSALGGSTVTKTGDPLISVAVTVGFAALAAAAVLGAAAWSRRRRRTGDLEES